MFRRMVPPTFLLLGALSVPSLGWGQVTEEGELASAATAFVEQLAARDFEGAALPFDSTMRAVMPPATLEETWDAVLAQVGAYQSWSATRASVLQGYDLVFVTTTFAHAVLDIRVVFDADHRIAGLFFQPHDPNPPAEVTLPDGLVEEDVTVGTGEWVLPGTLTAPATGANLPGVVLVHGSGPNDRDETVGANKPFRDLAWGLAARGLVVLRYDKRTNHYRERLAQATGRFTVNEEVIDDALAAAARLRSDPRVAADRVVILGHSLGGMLAPRIGARDASLAGLVLLAAPARPLETLIADQIGYLARLDGEVTDAERVRMEQLEQEMTRAAALTPADSAVSELILGAPAAYWLDLKEYDPVATAGTLAMPLLILHAGRDYQVTDADYDRWAAAFADDARVTLVVYPSLNHLFITGEGASDPSEYERPGHVDEVVLDDIAAWVHDRPDAP